MRNSSVTDPKMRSPLHEAMRVKPSSGGRGKRKITTTLVLTSLVDAFSIMLLYLLCQNTGNGSSLELNKAEKLPSAVRIEALSEGTMVRIDGHQYFLNEQPVQPVELAQRLQATRAANQMKGDPEALIIQADKTIDFAMLAPVIRAGSVTGFRKFKFAVLQDEESKL